MGEIEPKLVESENNKQEQLETTEGSKTAENHELDSEGSQNRHKVDEDHLEVGFEVDEGNNKAEEGNTPRFSISKTDLNNQNNLKKRSHRPEITLEESFFIVEYIKGKCKNASQAALDAGYDGPNPGKYAHDMLKRPSVQSHIRERVEQIKKRHSITTERIILGMFEVAENADCSNAAVKAWGHLGRWAGLDQDKLCTPQQQTPTIVFNNVPFDQLKPSSGGAVDDPNTAETTPEDSSNTPESL